MNETTLNNRFSWQRVGMVARFYYPSLRLPLMIYPAISLVIGLFSLWLSKTEIGFLFTGLLSMILSLMFYFFPLFFTKPSSPVVESMLPATTGERFTVFVIACLIINPIITFLPYYIIDWTIVNKPEIIEQITQFSYEFIAKSYGMGIAQSLPPLVTCLFVVFTRWKNRISASIGFTILTMVALGIIGGISGFIIAITDLIPHAENMTSSYEAGVELGKTMVNLILPIVIAIGTICMIYTAVMLLILYRKMRRQQL